jgi:glycerophosphoryl diester phosphodiesterase
MKNRCRLKYTGLIAKTIYICFLLTATSVVFLQHNAHAENAKRPILVAHRGANLEADENTLKAYKLAIQYGMDYIECDPRLTKDGVFVIMHDGNVNRMTNNTGKISDMTLAEIRALKTKNGEQIPTLEEVLSLAKEKGVRVYLDTKAYDDSYMEQLITQVKKAEMGDNVMAGLWTLEQLKFMQKKYPEIAKSIPYPTPISNMKTAKKLGANWVGTVLEQATDTAIKKADEAGLKIITMPINDKEIIVREIKAGMQIIQTDDPKLLCSVIDEMFSAK